MGTQKRIISKRRKIVSLILTVFSALILAGVAGVMLTVYDPSLNSMGALGSVSMDIICIIMVLLLMLCLVYDYEEINKTTELFLDLMIITAIALFFDFLNWAFDGTLAFHSWTYVFTTASLVQGALLGIFFVLYLSSYLVDMYGLTSSILPAKICAGVNVVSFLVTLTLALTHTAFEFNDGHYSTGALYDVVTALPLLTLLVMVIYAIRHVKVIGVHDLIAVLGYIILMVCGVLVEAANSVGTTYVAVSVADIYIFVLLQNRLIAKEKHNVQLWIQKSNTDGLTGFFNRHAYEDEINNLEEHGMGANFVYVSIDVNGLKKVNDTMGHAAGDEIIVGACDCIRQCFGSYGKLYRTGGDEFAALIFADEAQLEIIKKDIKEVTAGWKGKYCEQLAIACGYVAKKESPALSIRQIASLADKRMYEEKASYYMIKGIARREF